MLKTIFFLILIMILPFVGVVWGQTQKPVNRPDFLPISVWYSGGQARAPMLSEITASSPAEWRKDLEQIKALGFNTVRTWVEWAHCEPNPGDYHFENLKLLCQLAREVGLRVIIQMYVDSAPDWVGKKFPDGQFETQSGAKVLSQAAPGFCTDHQGVQNAVLSFYEATARIANQYDNFHGWDLWSEPHIVNWAYINYVPNVQFCFCPHTRAYFRQWLQEKYGTLAALNQAWYRNFASWDDVEPPRFGTILSYTDFIDWKNFIYQKLAQDLRLRYQAVRRADKTHVITSHAAVPSIFYSPYNGYGATDDFLMAEQVDFYGTSLYPKHNHPNRHWELWKFMVAVDFSRSANRKNGGFYVGELQAGKGTIGLQIGNPITPEDHRLWIWSVLARGGRAINIYAYYPMSSGYESGGYGLINPDGSITERARSAGAIARFVDQHQALFLQATPVPAQVALVYNPLAQMVGGEQYSGALDGHQNSLIGYYRFFAEHNIPVDFIHRRDLEADDLSQYKLIILPYALMFSQKAAESLEKFVQAGGFAVAEARLAWNDERGFAAREIPGLGLDQVFGVREQSIKMAEKAELSVQAGSHPAVSRIPAGGKLKGAYFAESLDLLNTTPAKIIARLDDGSPALVGSKYGKGETLFIGTFLGMANHQNPDTINNQLLLGMLDWAKINRPFTSSHDGNSAQPVDVRLLSHPEGKLLFVLNHSGANEKVTIALKMASDGQYGLEEIIGTKKIAVKARNKILELVTEIPGKQAQVWFIKTGV